MTEDTALRPPLELLLERSPAMDFARRTVTLGRDSRNQFSPAGQSSVRSTRWTASATCALPALV